ncbi:hypothetical protein ACH5RR_012529 [Cinchona calisaya]|uniref:Uncharacterized protein n=1 Tax=Cinchona calisaya TaxID=153742 RepID=A0ABD3A9M7_9GENT
MDKGKGKKVQVQQVYQKKSLAQPQVNNANHVTVEKLQIVASSSSTKENNPIQEEEEARVPRVNPIQAEASPSLVIVGTPSVLIKEVQTQEVISQIPALNQNQISNLNEEVEIFVEEVERNEAYAKVQMQEVLPIFNEKNQISNLKEVAQESAVKVGALNVFNSTNDSTLMQEV